MSNIEPIWEALDDLMVQINKPLPNNIKTRANILSGYDQDKLDREKIKGEALGLARAISLLTGRTVDDVREEAIRRYVGG